MGSPANEVVVCDNIPGHAQTTSPRRGGRGFDEIACFLHVTLVLRSSKLVVCCELRGRLFADMSWQTIIFIAYSRIRIATSL